MFENRIGVIVETPALEVPVDAVGAILQVFDYEIVRELNRIGTWRLIIGVHEKLSTFIRRGWRVSILEETTDADAPDWLLYRGVVINRNFIGMTAGSMVLELNGLFRTQSEYNDVTTHTGLAFNNDTLADMVLGIFGSAIPIPAIGSPIGTLTVTDVPKYAAGLKVAELFRMNLRETFDNDQLEFVSIDAVPNSGYTFQQLESVGIDVEDVHEMGVGLIVDPPKFLYAGDNIITRVIAEGQDIITDPDNPDGTLDVPLTLEHATRTGPYAVQSALNPDGSTYWYIDDPDAQAAYSGANPIEFYLKRTDIKNPANDDTTRTNAANALYQVACAELMHRRSEWTSAEFPIANGHRIWALPGDRVQVQYEGIAWNLATGNHNEYLRLNRPMLITQRVDHPGEAGTRIVDFTLSAPAYTLPNPDIPGEVIIPPPPGYMPSGPDPYAGYTPEAAPSSGTSLSGSAYSGCCDDPTLSVNDIDSSLPSSITPADPIEHPGEFGAPTGGGGGPTPFTDDDVFGFDTSGFALAIAGDSVYLCSVDDDAGPPSTTPNVVLTQLGTGSNAFGDHVSYYFAWTNDDLDGSLNGALRFMGVHGARKVLPDNAFTYTGGEMSQTQNAGDVVIGIREGGSQTGNLNTPVLSSIGYLLGPGTGTFGSDTFAVVAQMIKA